MYCFTTWLYVYNSLGKKDCQVLMCSKHLKLPLNPVFL